MKNRIFAFVFFGLAAVVQANDTIMYASGGSVSPMKSNPNVRMVSENIHVKLPEAIVEARFVFKNEGPATKILIGFPEEGYNAGALKKGQMSRFKWFKSWVDGKPIRVDRKTVENNNPETFESMFWWVKEVSFRKGETKTIVNRYRTTPGLAAWNNGYKMVTYIVNTGAAWKGTIGKATITFDLGSIAKKLSTEHTDKGYKRVGNKLIWTRRDFEPTSKDDMTVVWMDKKFKS